MQPTTPAPITATRGVGRSIDVPPGCVKLAASDPTSRAEPELRAGAFVSCRRRLTIEVGYAGRAPFVRGSPTQVLPRVRNTHVMPADAVHIVHQPPCGGRPTL